MGNGDRCGFIFLSNRYKVQGKGRFYLLSMNKLLTWLSNQNLLLIFFTIVNIMCLSSHLELFVILLFREIL